MDIVAIASSLAATAHGGQMRPDGKTLYIVHPMRVAARLQQGGASKEVCAAGWLHDVLEDTKTTVHDMVAAGIPAQVISAVEALTKRKGESYAAYILRVKTNMIAREVKRADMLDNLTDNPEPRYIVKYATGLLLLLDVYPKFSPDIMGAPQELPTCPGLWSRDGRAPCSVYYVHDALVIMFRRENTWRVSELPTSMRGNWIRENNLCV